MAKLKCALLQERVYSIPPVYFVNLHLSMRNLSKSFTLNLLSNLRKKFALISQVKAGTCVMVSTHLS